MPLDADHYVFLAGSISGVVEGVTVQVRWVGEGEMSGLPVTLSAESATITIRSLLLSCYL